MNRINRLRRRRLVARPDVSLRGLCRELTTGLSHPSLSAIETGKRDAISLAQISELARVLRVSPYLVLEDLLADRPHLMNGRPGKEKKASKVARRGGRVKKNNGRRS